MQLMHDSDCEWRLGHDCTCAKTDPRDATIARLTAERDEARAAAKAAYERAAQHCFDKAAQRLIRALATEAETNALAEIVKKAVDAETRACSKICATLGVLGGVKKNPYACWKTHADNLEAAILARLDQRKEAGE